LRGLTAFDLEALLDLWTRLPADPAAAAGAVRLVEEG